MNKKKIIILLIFIAGLSFLTLHASTNLDIKLRVFEGNRHEPLAPPQFVTSSYIRPTITASIQSDFKLENEIKQIKRVFNLQNVNLLTEADLHFPSKNKNPDSVSHFFRLNGNEYSIRVLLEEWKYKGQFLILVNEHVGDEKKNVENVLTTEITLLGGNMAVFGFEDRKGKPYFLSFHITGPEDKVLPVPPPPPPPPAKKKVLPTPPPPPPPPLSKELKKEIEEFEKGAVKTTGSITPPKCIKKIEPIYPLEARKNRVSGVVVLSVRTDIRGRVSKVMVLRSIPKLDKAAVDAVKQWIYEPFILDGKPSPVVFTIRVTFKLT